MKASYAHDLLFNLRDELKDADHLKPEEDVAFKKILRSLRDEALKEV